MMKRSDLAVVIQSVGKVLKQAIDGIERRLTEQDQKIREIPSGPPGKDGINGQNGRDGTDGKDGSPGKDGERGERGEKGEPGIEGRNGERGAQGERGESGERGEKGEAGLRGERGEKGEPGTAGRDALQIDILPSVDFAKAYPRGTVSRHNGGLIRAFRDTIPGDSLVSCGFEVILNGFSAPEFIQDDSLREFSFIVRMTSGEVIETMFSIPAMIYRGVWRESENYRQGDMLTFGGSTWHCNVTGTKAKPGTEGNDWTLAVKEGRRGKDGENGKDYTPPKPTKL